MGKLGSAFSIQYSVIGVQSCRSGWHHLGHPLQLKARQRVTHQRRPIPFSFSLRFRQSGLSIRFYLPEAAAGDWVVDQASDAIILFS